MGETFSSILVLLKRNVVLAILILAVLSWASYLKAQSVGSQTEAPLHWPTQPEGAGRCIACHRAEVEGYARSAMAHSLRRAAKEPDGTVTTPDTKITASDTENGYWQRLEPTAGAEAMNYRIDYVIGSGNHASGYLLDLANHLFQSPIAYYKTRHSYDLAPGYEGLANPDFTRPVAEGCLFCHSGNALHVEGTRNEYRSPPFSAEAITCERCHGPAEKHLNDPRAGTIINPAKLEPAARDSICEQCHLLGVGRVLNPGKKFSDFIPGEPLENVFTTYHVSLPPGTDAGKFKVISQVEQLARSMCSRMSAGRMWCGTCHDPHGKPLEPVQYFRNKCLSCHTGKFPASEHHPGKESDCIGCHMPKRNAKDGGHTVFTDHRIQRRPSVEQELPENVDIAAWRQPAPELQKRNLGIAYVNAGAERRSPDFVVRGYRLLTEVQQQFSSDDAIFTAIGTALLLGKQPKEAEFAFDRALQLEPGSVSGETNDASAYLQAGDIDHAISHLQRAVAIDPLDLTAVAPLIDLYRRKGNTARADELSRTIASTLKRESTDVPQAAAVLPAGKRYKNIQVLKGIPADQLIPAMRFITQSLGVECSYCHVPNHFEEDSRKTKQTAREMMRMMNAINGSSFEGVRAVTCYSCHRGSPKPESVPAISNVAQQKTAPDIMTTPETLTANLPTVDQLVAKYIQAMGGASALENISTREEQGTVSSDGKTGKIEIFDKFSDRHAVIRHLPGGENFTILNGSAGWLGASGRFVHEMDGSDLDATKIANDLHLPLDIRRIFELRVEYPEKLSSRETQVLLATRPDHPPMKLYFDEQSGLLVRLVQFAESPLGRVPRQIDYDDYRGVDGVQVPFRLTVGEADGISTITLDRVVHNAAIDEEKFEKPAQ